MSNRVPDENGFITVKDEDGYTIHYKPYPPFERNDKIIGIGTRKRCLNCICENAKNETDDITNCPVIPNNMFPPWMFK